MSGDNSPSHSGWQPLYCSLIERENESLKTLRSESLEEIESFIFDFEREVITLDHLLRFLASDALLLLKKETPQKLQKVDLLYYESYKILLGNAKRDILSGKLKVKQLVTLAPINNEPSIIAWCNKNHTLEGVDLSKPHRRIVVMLNDARAWIIANEIPMPSWLASGHTPSVTQIKEPECEKYRRRYRELLRDNNPSKIKTLAKEFNRSESNVRKYL